MTGRRKIFSRLNSERSRQRGIKISRRGTFRTMGKSGHPPGRNKLTDPKKKKLSVKEETDITGIVSQRSQSATNMFDSTNGSETLRRSKRSRNEVIDSGKDDSNKQRPLSKRARLQFVPSISASTTAPMPKLSEGSRILRSHRKVTTNNLVSNTDLHARADQKANEKKASSTIRKMSPSKKPVEPKKLNKIADQKANEKVKARSLTKKKPLSKKSVESEKGTKLRNKTAELHQKGVEKPTRQVLQKTKKQQIAQPLTTVKKNVRAVIDANNNEVTIEKEKGKRKGKRKELNTEKGNGNVKKRKSRNRLDPKPFVTEYLQDPTFYSREPIPHISTLANSKLLIRAVLLEDNQLLEELIKDTKSICSLLVERSLNIERNAFSYALERGNIEAMSLLMLVHDIDDTISKSLGHYPSIILSDETTGSNSTYMFGHAVRSVTVGRGGREGNNALLKDRNSYYTSRVKTNLVDNDHEEALRFGLSMQKLQEINKELTSDSWERYKEILYDDLKSAIRAGHNQLAGKLVESLLEKDGYGYNNLHKEVLLHSTEPLTPFKSVSVVKKPHNNPRITPLHFACINPNPEYLVKLIQSNPVYDFPDQDKWLPIHYASVCTGKGPLEVLLTRDVSINQYTKEGESPLHLASSLGRLENVELLLAHESKKITAETSSQSLLERKTKSGDSPLHLAVREGRLEVVKCLIRGGANPNRFTPARFGKLNPLMIAATYGHLDILKFLTDEDVKIEAVDNRGRTALVHAVIDGQAHIVSYLLRLGANHRITDSSLNTLVHYAAAYGWYFNLKLLLEAGCPLNEENSWKMTPLVIAFSKGHMGIVEFILGKCEVNINSIINDKNGFTLLLQTCAGSPDGEYSSKIKFLIEEQNADATIKDFTNNNALHFVVLNEWRKLSSVDHENSETQKTLFDVAKLLIDRGCDPLDKNSEDMSPIFLAFNRRCFLLTMKFLEWGYPIPEENDVQGNNFLHIISTLLDSTQAVELLKTCSKNPIHLQKMKDMVDIPNNAGYPPLLHLLFKTANIIDEKHRSNILEFLMFLINTLDVDITAVDSISNDSIFHILCDVSYMDKVLDIILPLYSNLEVQNYGKLTPLALAITKNKETAAIALINAGANVNTEFPNGNSLLIKIGSEGTCSSNFLQLVLKKGANILDVDKHTKNTILHYIVRKPNQPLAIETVDQLIKAGININATNNHGRTALHLVVNSRGGEIDSSYEIEKLLIKAGANLGIRDIRGRLPLHMVFVKIGKHTNMSFIDPIELLGLLVGAMKDSVKDFSDEIKKGDNFGAIPLHYAAYRGASICCSYLIMLMNGYKDALDNNGNTPFGLAVLNAHEGCSLQFKQLGADFSLLLYPNKVGSIERPKSKPYQWNCITYKKEEEIKNIVVPKHPIIEEVIRKDWQGILYLILETLNNSGVGSSLAIASAIRIGRMKLVDKLVDQAVASELKTKDGNSLLHTLAEYNRGEYTLLEKIVKTLIHKGVSPVALNSDRCTPLIYPAINRNHFLCQLLTDMTPKEDQALFNSFDKYGRNPFSALFWALNDTTSIDGPLKRWAENLVMLGVSTNTLCAFPIELQSFPSVRYLRCESKLEFLPVNYTPLILAVIVGNHDAVKWLLTMDVPNSVDINETDHKGRTALMHAVRLNDIKMVKILMDPFSYDPTKDVNPWEEQDLKQDSNGPETKLSFSMQDTQGWTVADYLVASFDTFYFAKANMLLNLLGSRVLLQQKSGDGKSPHERAIKMNRVRLVEAIEDILGIDEDKRTKLDPFGVLYQSSGLQTEENFIEDCQEMTKLILEGEKAKVSDNKIDPDPVLKASDLTKEYTVLVDEQENIAYNCSLVHVDLSYGTYGLYNFYKMQVVEQERGSIKLILLFTRWGRVGDTGQYQKTPFATKDEAIKEFKKVFRAKTGNAWENLNAFIPVDKKYRLVNEANEETKKASPVKINFLLFNKFYQESHDDIIQLMKTLYLPHSEVKYQSFVPRGSLTRETYQRGEEILGQIALLVQSDANKKNPNDPETENQTKAIEMLSEEYYSLIPIDNFSSEKLKPITSENDIRRKQEWIHRLIHLNLASQIILAAEYRLAYHSVNPFEYIYRSLRTNLQVLDANSEDAQFILEYIHNASNTFDVSKIYSVERFGEPERFKTCGVGNPWLLWHGTDNINLLSILQRGLQVAPFGTRLNGDLFGRGIYFSDTFTKSAKYCRGRAPKYVFLCEVALGNIHPVNFEYSTGLEKRKAPPTNCHSLKTSNSLWEPDPSSTIVWKERTVPLGVPKKNHLWWTDDHTNRGGLNNNEYIIFDENQVILRYLVEFN